MFFSILSSVEMKILWYPFYKDPFPEIVETSCVMYQELC